MLDQHQDIEHAKRRRDRDKEVARHKFPSMVAQTMSGPSSNKSVKRFMSMRSHRLTIQCARVMANYPNGLQCKATQTEHWSWTPGGFAPGGADLPNDGIISLCPHHNRSPPALACKSFWPYRRTSALTSSGMRSMSLKSSSPPPIASNLSSKALGETPLHPPPVNLDPGAARRARSRSRKPKRGDPSRIRRDASSSNAVAVSLFLDAEPALSQLTLVW